jgi:hypothetical protein
MKPDIKFIRENYPVSEEWELIFTYIEELEQVVEYVDKYVRDAPTLTRGDSWGAFYRLQRVMDEFRRAK